MATANMEPLDAVSDTPATGESVEESAAAPPCAFGIEFVRSHQEDIWWYLRFLGCQEAEANDLAQETFLAVLKKPPVDRGLAALRVFLRTIARNKFVESLRKHRREAEFDLDAAEQAWATAQTEASDDARLEALDDCINQLEGRAKQVIELTYRDNRSRADIAAAMEMTESGVKSLLRRTRDVLRQCVERKLGGESK